MTHLHRSRRADEEAPGLGAEARGDAHQHEHEDALGLDRLTRQPVADSQVSGRAGGLERHLDQQDADVVGREAVPAVEVLPGQDLHFQRDWAVLTFKRLITMDGSYNRLPTF
jgi:hypothetical protein